MELDMGIIGVVVAIFTLAGNALGIFFYVKFSGAQNTSDINDLKLRIVPELRKELTNDIKERVHQNDCINREKLSVMQIKQIEEKLDMHGEAIESQSKDIKKMTRILLSMSDSLTKILDKITK